MAEDRNSRTTPRLRFPKFRKGWARQPLSSLLDYERPEKYIVSNTVYQSRGTPVLTANKGFVLGYTNETFGIYTALPVIIFDDFTTDRKYVDFPFKVKSSAIKLLKNKGDNSLKLIFELMGGIKFDPKEHKRYYISEYQNIEISLPDAFEQQKIADCLTSLDELIAAQARKVEALKAYKRGLVQQLFPREGETLPRLRFSEFRNRPEWKEIKAVELFANRTEKGDDYLPIYSVTMVHGLVKRSSLDRRVDDLADTEGNKKVYKRDIAYNMMRMWQGACGVAYDECMVSPAYVVLSPHTGVYSDFYAYLFKSPQMLRLLTSHSRGLTKDRLRLYYQDFGRIPLPFPDIREQRRIANCLYSLDAQITAESKKVDALKTHKKGLTQQLFPSLKGD